MTNLAIRAERDQGDSRYSTIKDMAKLPENLPIRTVRELTADVKAVIETGFQNVWIVGEISSLSRPSSGHLYFSLKDKEALVRAVVWRSTAQRLGFQPHDGLEVIGRGKLTVYPPRGDYQLVLDELHPKGLGIQDLALRKLKEKLAALGWFAPERKKPLPRFPRRLALVTSLSGAAVRDMLEILGRRWPLAEVWVVGVRVQGAGAAIEIASVLKFLDRLPQIDTILLGRGGGSSEDLSAFNDEIVAKAIFECRIPIISAVGHEIDVTIADLVADRRALTPSEAAELATPDREELLQHLRQRSHRLVDLMRGRINALKHRLAGLSQSRVLRQPLEAVREREQRLDDWHERLRRAMNQRLERHRHALAARAAQLDSLSPLNVLARGYSLTRIDGKLLHSVQSVVVGDALEIILADGRLQAAVEQVLRPLVPPSTVPPHEFLL
jgi:exodeoxyribonuclease VII large subunit